VPSEVRQLSADPPESGRTAGRGVTAGDWRSVRSRTAGRVATDRVGRASGAITATARPAPAVSRRSTRIRLRTSSGSSWRRATNGVTSGSSRESPRRLAIAWTIPSERWTAVRVTPRVSVVISPWRGTAIRFSRPKRPPSRTWWCWSRSPMKRVEQKLQRS
jgi:hypothetical protein